MWVITALAGSALFVSPENGIAAMMGLVVTALLNAAYREKRGFGLRLGLCAVGAGVVFFMLIGWVTSGAPMAYMEYALRDIHGDQFWYFGAPPNHYLPNDWRDLMSGGFYIFSALYTAGVALTISMWRVGSKYRSSAVFLIIYSTFSLVSQLGYLSHLNLQGSERALFLIIIFAMAQFLQLRLVPIFSFVALIGIACCSYTYRIKLVHAWPDRREENGDFLSSYWKNQLAAIRQLSKDGDIWSIYAGLPEADRNSFAPSFDYIIHALGKKNRERYSTAFADAKPTLVRLDNALTWSYGWWLISSNWDFYRRVFAHYDLAYQDKMSTLWIRSEQLNIIDHQTSRPDLEGNCFKVKESALEGSVFSVHLRYSIANPWQSLPLLGKTPRLILFSGRPKDYGMSIPPPDLYGGSWEFPLVLKADEDVKMCLKVDTFLPNVSATIEEITVTKVPITDSAKRYLSEIW